MASTLGHFGAKISKEDFNFITVIGEGCLGKVWHAKEKNSDRDVAIKEMSKAAVIDADFNRQVVNEVTIHSKLRHDNIIQFFNYFEARDHVYIVQEYVSGGTLYCMALDKKCRRMGNLLSAKYCYQAADALQYMHNEGYFHGDLKPENILIDDYGDAKLCDFGTSWKFAQDTEDQVYCGTTEYLAPERISGDYYDFTIDHWSLGILLYELLVGRSPFHGRTKVAITNKILAKKYTFTRFVPEEAKDLIQKLLVRRECRMRLCEVMAHPFIRMNYNP